MKPFGTLTTAFAGIVATLALPSLASAEHEHYQKHGRTPSLILYDGGHFNGRAVKLKGAVGDLRVFGFTDMAASLEFGPRQNGWLLCKHNDFKGPCIVAREPIRHLDRYGLDDEISSVAPLSLDNPFPHGTIFDEDYWGNLTFYEVGLFGWLSETTYETDQRYRYYGVLPSVGHRQVNHFHDFGRSSRYFYCPMDHDHSVHLGRGRDTRFGYSGQRLRLERERRLREQRRRERAEERLRDERSAMHELAERIQRQRNRAEREQRQRDRAERQAREERQREMAEREQRQRDRAERQAREERQRDVVEREQRQRDRAERQAREERQRDVAEREQRQRERAERQAREERQRDVAEREQRQRERAERQAREERQRMMAEARSRARETEGPARSGGRERDADRIERRRAPGRVERDKRQRELANVEPKRQDSYPIKLHRIRPEDR